MQDLNINNASPRSVHPGIQDEPNRVIPFTPEQVPQHCPLFGVQTPLGTERVVLSTGADMLVSHGATALDQRSKFYSHQTHGLTRCNAEGNLFFLKRLCDENAKKAHVVFYLEVVKTLALPYQRDPLGNVVTANGVKQTTGTAGVDFVEVYKLRWTAETLPVGETLDNPSAQVGTMTSLIPGETSMKYPMFAIEHASKGALGNNYGIELWFPHEQSTSPGDSVVMDKYMANLYRARVMFRKNNYTVANVQQTALGMEFTDVPFNEEFFNDLTNRTYKDEDMIEAFENEEEGSLARPAPFGRFEVYYDYIDLVRELIAPQEAALSGQVVEPGQVNIFNEYNRAGSDQYAIRYDNASLSFKAGNTHYLQGGDDGEVSEAKLDELMGNFIENQYDDVESPLRDMAQFPFTDLYDTGFSVNTKYALLSAMGKRPDTFVTVCTQDLSLPDNDLATELSMASGLYSTARLIPESVQYGTPAIRACITGQMGNVTRNDHIRRRRFPLVMDLITKRSRYMGAGDGKMKSGDAYDDGTNRHVQNFKVDTITHRWKPEATYFADWKSGLNGVRMIDTKRAYWPAVQTVHSRDTSVLNSDINVHICCDVIRRQHLVWASLTGNALLTRNELFSESVRIFNDLVANRYDGRVTINTVAYETAADAARGYSWAMDSTVNMNNMPTVATMNVKARRAADLEAAA